MSTSTLTFTTGSPSSVNGPGSSPGLVWSLPAYLDQTFGESFGTTIATFPLTGGISGQAGLTGGVDLTFGQYSLNYGVTINAGLPTGPVADGTTFTVDPTLVSVDDSSFALNGPGVAASLFLGVNGGASIAFNQGSSIGASFSVNPNFSIGYSLPQSYTFQPTTGVSIVIAEPAGFSTVVPLTGGGTSLAAISGGGTDNAFLTASADLIALLAQLAPAVAAVIDGGQDLSVASLSWSLLSLPLAASLSLDQSLTITPSGIGVTLDEMQNGATLAVDTGTLGQSFSFLAPSSGTGVIQIDATYTLNFQVQTSTGIVGDINLSLLGPQFGGTIAGAGATIGPFGSLQLFDFTAGLGNVSSTTFNSSLTTTAEYDINFASPACFCAGTRILTGRGEVAVEDLRLGDELVTVDGEGRRRERVRWIGRSAVSRRGSDPLRVLPIRIRAGALGDSLPARDLLVSPNHAVMLDGVLVDAHALVNGVTIVRETAAPMDFTYYHVELDRHALLLAEGVPTESFLEAVEDMPFSNWADRAAPAVPVAALPFPRAKSARQLPRHIRERITVAIAA